MIGLQFSDELAMGLYDNETLLNTLQVLPCREFTIYGYQSLIGTGDTRKGARL